MARRQRPGVPSLALRSFLREYLSDIFLESDRFFRALHSHRGGRVVDVDEPDEPLVAAERTADGPTRSLHARAALRARVVTAHGLPRQLIRLEADGALVGGLDDLGDLGEAGVTVPCDNLGQDGGETNGTTGSGNLTATLDGGGGERRGGVRGDVGHTDRRYAITVTDTPPTTRSTHGGRATTLDIVLTITSVILPNKVGDVGGSGDYASAEHLFILRVHMTWVPFGQVFGDRAFFKTVRPTPAPSR